ncbi:dimethylamine methyltransferase [Candidatus Formimonas warabiya]|uniref:Dimethylamine methyltransferase n=1 Tax=Formimonas warabiya TaxID=1761012 RepID=A0A3G1KWX5_FORW1|nr:dimethylamine methyltransferase [Candidatus Formimonas warabiya]
MEIAHEVACGMGGIRTAGDLVLRMQLSKGMKINDAKKYVAEKLGVSPVDLSDCAIMREIREDLNLGRPMPPDHVAKGMEAKIRIAKALDIKINSVERFMRMAGLK